MSYNRRRNVRTKRPYYLNCPTYWLLYCSNRQSYAESYAETVTSKVRLFRLGKRPPEKTIDQQCDMPEVEAITESIGDTGTHKDD